MDTAGFLLRFLRDFQQPGFDSRRAVEALGQPVDQTEKRWRLRPRDSLWSDCTLYFEDLAAGKGLLTTIELEFQEPWRVSVPELEETFGSNRRWLPRPGPGRLRVLQFESPATGLRSLIMLRVAGRSEDCPLVIASVLLRRFFDTASYNQNG